jgi:hypothetical protein
MSRIAIGRVRDEVFGSMVATCVAPGTVPELVAA